MSNRALRRLHGNADILDSLAVAGVQIGETEEADENVDLETSPSLDEPVTRRKTKHKKTKNQVSNVFELLSDEGLPGENEVSEDAKEDDVEKQTTTSSAGNKKRKKKKKQKKDVPLTDAEPVNEQNTADEIEASVQEVNRILGAAQVLRGTVSLSESTKNEPLPHALLCIEHKYLNYTNEMRRRFGSRVVQSDQSRQRNRVRGHQRTTKLVQPRDNWPPPGRTGLTMSLLQTTGSIQTFTFEHSVQYQKVQFQFLDAVESYNPQNLSNLLHDHPYHIDSLLQLSEVFRMGEDLQTAAELVERALFASEYAFHPLFNLATGTCRLDYRRQENRSFYLALFKQLVSVGQKGCYRTALELCKLLLSMDPDGDPLCVLLMIDFYALRAEEYGFLIRLYEEWENHRNLSQLPNFAFSVPLAMFHAAQENLQEISRATAMLENSLLMFPMVLSEVLNKISVQADPEVADHSFFGSNSYARQPEALRQLVALYVGRCASCWKEPSALQWLEQTVHRVLKLVDASDPRVEDYRKKCSTRYQGTPRNIHRHIILSEIKDATAALPPDLARSPLLSYDPLPPADAIISYSRPARSRAAQSENSLTLFLRSLLPNYSADNPLADADLGAAGGEEEGDNAGRNLRRGVGVLMDAMRDLLNNLHPFPPPVENEQARERGEEDGDEEEANWNDED